MKTNTAKKRKRVPRPKAVKVQRIVPRWWGIRKRFENCNTGFCKHCGWMNPPSAIYRAAKRPNAELSESAQNT